MTPSEIEQLVKEIVDGANSAAAFIGVIDPALIPFLVIGRAISNQVPGLAKTVTNWVEGNPPTADEKAEMARKLAVLGDASLP